jgi:AcrR family transcriptional regulator
MAIHRIPSLREGVNRDSLLHVPYRPTERTEARRLATRERIVGAALDQVAEGGYASAGMQAVAGRAGVAVGTVYRHFPSKGYLFTEAFRRASQRELDVVVQVSDRDDRPARERLAAAVEAFCRRALAGPVLAYALLAEPVDPAVEAERLRFRTGYRDAFARVLEDGVRDGELRAHDTQTVAAALVGALGEALVGPLSAANGPGSHDPLIATLVQFCEEALPRAHERVHA